MAQNARKLNFMIDNDVADELERLIPSGQRSRVVSQAIANELALQRRRSITSRLRELRSHLPVVSAEKLQVDLAENRRRG
ncbi:hypothetical protein [Geobacter argillaceus]|uniref:Uncharacterized protein n=1 Tax=Geobacter argillaceus TaxID=345631 RepID=A0A562VLY9_9BACT|nr:hypothetical protein [Geobacter argillaceus]TWJ18976.1 hypothetical protein JN12_02193 [Geobacter argillaceus]